MNLSTGQMIDILKIGEIAECVSDGFYEGSQLKRTDYNEIVFVPSGDLFKLTTFAYTAKWKIMPSDKRKKLTHSLLDKEKWTSEARHGHDPMTGDSW